MPASQSSLVGLMVRAVMFEEVEDSGITISPLQGDWPRPPACGRPFGPRRGPSQSCSLPLLSGQAFGQGPLLPVRPGECANDAAVGTGHAWAEGRHRHGIAVTVHIQHRFMVT